MRYDRIFVLVIVALFIPLMALADIWALNTLFPMFQIPYTVTSCFAVSILLISVMK